MQYWVGVTDKNWFEFLRLRSPDEVNFWQPSSKPLANFLQPGTPFLFKLHAPHNFIVGGGFFVRFSALPARLAWSAFGEKNGVADYPGLKRRVERYRHEQSHGDVEIGCNILNAPFFFDEDAWIPPPKDWERNIVRGRTYDTASTTGHDLWDAIEARLNSTADSNAAHEEARYGSEYLTRARLGQGAFRILVTDAYTRRCAITGEKTLPVLEAAHIRPYSETGPHLISNGMLLRSDLHTLFDAGYLTITREHKILVSRRIREEFQNGREYYAYHGKTLAVLPEREDDRPSPDFVTWHNEHRFLE